MLFEIPLFSFGLNFFVYRWYSNVDFAKTFSDNIPKSVSGKELVSTRHKKGFLLGNFKNRHGLPKTDIKES